MILSFIKDKIKYKKVNIMKKKSRIPSVMGFDATPLQMYQFAIALLCFWLEYI